MTREQIAALTERVAAWPEEAQAELLRSLLRIETKFSGVHHLSADEAAAVEEGLAQADRAEFVSDDEMAALFERRRA